ncbi:MAG: OmpA family protein [Robiginitomaculum sp.]|nr:OmpA family protein [Robiginitomaculum sp.]
MSAEVEECQRPIIIRRKKIYAAEGHHGGAWKVAYADFVTAMMAFFLLMWLLNATTEEQRKGISDYFNPSIPLAAVSGGGSDALSGDSIFAENTLARNGTGANSQRTFSKDTIPDEGENTDKADFDNLAELANAMGEENRHISEHMQVKMSPEGLVIELIDKDGEPLFSIGQSKPSPLMLELVTIVSNAFRDVENNIKIVGHTDSRAFIGNKDGAGQYSNWELSSDRANMARRLLIKNRFRANQIVEVAGKADTDRVVSDGMAAQNRRISIIILK